MQNNASNSVAARQKNPPAKMTPEEESHVEQGLKDLKEGRYKQFKNSSELFAHLDSD